MADGWPLIGRLAELGYVCSVVREGRGVVLAGAAGVGKTRLLDELAATLAAEDWHVQRVVGTPAVSAFPLGAFAFLDEPATGEVTVFDSPLAAARREVLGRGGGRQLLLAVDDAQHLDDASAALVHQLAVMGDAVVAATVRSSEPVPDAIVALWKDERCERVELQPLARRETDELLEAVLEGRVDPEARRALWDASQGNLLYLRELLRDGRSRGLLHNDGTWHWKRPEHPPESVRELIGRQVRALSADARRALELVALAEPLEWDLLTGLVPTSVADALVDDGQLVGQRDDRRLVARLSHPLVADVVRADVPEPRRRRLLRELVAALPAPGRRRTDMLRRVTWSIEIGREVDTSDIIETARRILLLDTARAEQFATLARERGAGIEAVVVLAQILMFTRRAREAEQLLSPVPVPRIDDDIALTITRANNLTFGLSDPEPAVALLDDLLTRVTDEKHRRRVRAQRFPMLLFAGRVRELLEEGDAFLDDADVEPADRMRAIFVLVPALAAAGRPLTATALAESAGALVAETQTELPYALGQLAAGSILALHWSARLDDADAIARFGYDEGTRVHAQLLRGVSAFHLGLGAYWRGTMRTAERYFDEAISALRHTDVGFRPSASDHLRAVQTMLRDVDAPGAEVEDGTRFPLYETERLRLAGVEAAGRGDLRRACDLAEQAAVVAKTMGLRMHEAFAHWDGARYGEPAEVRARLDAAAAECEGPLAPLLATATQALAEGSADDLETASHELEALGFTLWAAELARAAARTHGSAGLRARESGADARADALLARCEGATSPLGDRGPAQGVELTKREREIAELAVRGSSNAEIAARLSISVRTVETHLQHVYGKLGVASRQELAGALGH